MNLSWTRPVAVDAPPAPAVPSEPMPAPEPGAVFAVAVVSKKTGALLWLTDSSLRTEDEARTEAAKWTEHESGRRDSAHSFVVGKFVPVKGEQR